MAKRISHQPLVSVVTPVFNRPKEIVECSQAMICQTYQNWEHIIVDDASTDVTKEIIDSATDFRIRPIHLKQNQGPQFAYDEGFKHCRGEYTFLQDSDDIPTPDRLEKCFNYLTTHPDIDLLYHGMYQTFPHFKLPLDVWFYKPALPFDRKRLEKEQFVPGMAIVRTKFVRAFEPRVDIRGSWDWYFLLHMMYQGAKFAHLDEGLYIYRRHEQGMAAQYEIQGKRKQSLDTIREYIRRTKRLGRTR